MLKGFFKENGTHRDKFMDSSDFWARQFWLVYTTCFYGDLKKIIPELSSDIPLNKSFGHFIVLAHLEELLH